MSNDSIQPEDGQPVPTSAPRRPSFVELLETHGHGGQPKDAISLLTLMTMGSADTNVSANAGQKFMAYRQKMGNQDIVVTVRENTVWISNVDLKDATEEQLKDERILSESMRLRLNEGYIWSVVA